MTHTSDSGHHSKFMKRAIELSYYAIENRHGNPFGSVVVRDGVVVGEGWNQVTLLNDPSAHAEMMAVRDASQRLSSPILSGCVVYASGQPCPMCLSLIYLAGIEKVYYCIPGETMASLNPALSVDHIYKAIGTPQAQRPIHEIRIMEEELNGIIARYKDAFHKNQDAR